MRHGLTLIVAVLVAGAARAGDFPQTTLKNDSLSLTVYLPDAKKGFYRGTRFDWAGVFGNGEIAGRKVFGPWKDTHDPANHDDIVGPAEEFGMTAPLGYAEAKEGETFLKIGVGELVKPKEENYRFYYNYPIRRPGTWDVTVRPQEVEFKQTLLSKSGYGYRYAKTIALDSTEGRFAIRHELTNSGTKPIDTDHYNHNFYNVDNDPVGPNYRVQFPAPVRVPDPKERFGEVVAVRGDSFVFVKPLDKGSVFGAVDGLAGQVGGDGLRGAICISHTKSELVLWISGDTPLEKVNFWATTRTLCPEPFIRIRLKPGETKSWSVRYRFGIDRP